jgi:hypothetical protein
VEAPHQHVVGCRVHCVCSAEIDGGRRLCAETVACVMAAVVCGVLRQQPVFDPRQQLTIDSCWHWQLAGMMLAETGHVWDRQLLHY